MLSQFYQSCKKCKKNCSVSLVHEYLLVSRSRCGDHQVTVLCMNMRQDFLLNPALVSTRVVNNTFYSYYCFVIIIKKKKI